jgi:hypothetical protein
MTRTLVKELFPGGVWFVYPDPEGRRFLWTYAETADPQLESLVGVGGLAPTDAFSRAYNAVATESRKVGDFGSGGSIPHLLATIPRRPKSSK